MRTVQRASSQPSQSLTRRLGLFDGAALVVSNMIGVGIFTTPGIIAGMVPHPVAFLGVWVVGGLLAFIGALAYAELAALHPQAGGEYLYLREAFGPQAGFLAGWTSFVAGFSGAIAAVAVGFAAYLGRFIPWAASTDPLLAIPLGLTALEISPRTLVALAVILMVSAVHVRGLEPGRRFQNGLAIGSVLTIMGLLLFGFTVADTAAELVVSPRAPLELGQWLLALILVMFTYSGWNAAVYVAEEVRNPERNVLRALLLGTIAVIVLYVLLNGLYLYALPMADLAGIIEVGDATAEALFGSAGAVLLTLVILLALASSVSAMVVTGPRIYFAMARDGVFPPFASRIHPRFKTPTLAIIMQGLWSSLLVISGTFEALLTYTGFAVVLFAALSVLALFKLRRLYGTKSSLGFSFLLALFVIFSLVIVVNALLTTPLPSIAGLLIISTGIPLYRWYNTSRQT